MGYTAAELKDKITLGRDSIFRVAPLGANGAMPAAAAYKELCLASEVTVGFENRTISFQNFCTGGDEIEIPVGSTGSVDLSEMQWIEDDEALLIMETAARDLAPIAYEYLPAGAGTGKTVYRGIMDVKSWKVKSASDGTVTVESPTLGAPGKPEKGTLA